MRTGFRAFWLFVPVTLAIVLSETACSSEKEPGTSPSVAPSAASAQPGGLRASSEWPSYNGGYNATRFSPVTQINNANAGSLTEVARFSLPETTSFQSGQYWLTGRFM